jgi:hypothetical protein
MKYMITMTDEQVKHFKLDSNGKTIVLTDIHGIAKAFPIESDQYLSCFLCGSPKTMLFCPYIQSLSKRSSERRKRGRRMSKEMIDRNLFVQSINESIAEAQKWGAVAEDNNVPCKEESEENKWE